MVAADFMVYRRQAEYRCSCGAWGTYLMPRSDAGDAAILEQAREHAARGPDHVVKVLSVTDVELIPSPAGS